jgi:hypothetical protein
MAAVGDAISYIEELEKRVRALEADPARSKRVFCQDGTFTSHEDTRVIDVGFTPSQVAVSGATYNPNTSQGSMVHIQGPEGPKYLLIAVE